MGLKQSSTGAAVIIGNKCARLVVCLELRIQTLMSILENAVKHFLEQFVKIIKRV